MKVLLIDDEPSMVREVVYALQAATGSDGKAYEVTALGSHIDALNLLRKERFDVVVTDMVMGPTEREGFDVVKSLTRMSPVTIVMTAWPKFPGCVEAMRFGAWDYLEKQPADGSSFFDNLLESISAACKHRTWRCEGGRVHPDMAWCEDNYEKLARLHAGKYVAVLDRMIVDSDSDYQAMAVRLRDKFPAAVPAVLMLPCGK
jgi:DNA-binding NtrC family response regulator